MKKSLKLLCLLLIGIVLSGCNLEESIFESSSREINQTYYLTKNDIEEYAIMSDENCAVVVSQIIMPATVEVNVTITFSYTENYFSPWGITSQTKTANVSGSATAFFINEEGYLMTNAHVVSLEDYESYPDFKYIEWDVKINYADSEVKFDCVVVDYDTNLDLAILKTDPTKIENLSYVTFFDLTSPSSEEYTSENATRLYYGETVIAIGNTLGYGISVTQGVVSAPIRYFQNGNILVEAIQTDAAINEGNSGGVLANKYGAVVGINSFKIVTDTSEGLGYAIPSNVVSKYLDSQEESIKYYTTIERIYKG